MSRASSVAHLQSLCLLALGAVLAGCAGGRGPSPPVAPPSTEDPIDRTVVVTPLTPLPPVNDSAPGPPAIGPGAVPAYQARLPAASSPGRLVRLELRDGGGAVLVTDYLNGRPPIMRSGTWLAAGTDRVAVELGTAGGTERENLVFRSVADTLQAVEYDRATYGTRGLALVLVNDTTPGPALEGTRWELTELRGTAVTATAERRPTLEFLTGGRVAGNTGCNLMSGTYEASGSSLRLGPLATTRRACLDGTTGIEQTYVRALDATTRYTVAEGVLTLFAGTETVARFRRVANS